MQDEPSSDSFDSSSGLRKDVLWSESLVWGSSQLSTWSDATGLLFSIVGLDADELLKWLILDAAWVLGPQMFGVEELLFGSFEPWWSLGKECSLSSSGSDPAGLDLTELFKWFKLDDARVLETLMFGVLKPSCFLPFCIGGWQRVLCFIYRILSSMTWYGRTTQMVGTGWWLHFLWPDYF